jgi:8-oxo-dGTP pyrophosphatase MutT (NUDIX family)
MGAWLPAEQWYASLPTVYVSAGALMTDAAGRVLLVKPNYRAHWSFPGGVLEHAEAPHDGCAREVYEEVGLKRDIGPLLVTSWLPPAGERPRSAMYLLFDGGVLADDVRIVLQEDELDDYAFCAPDDAERRLDPSTADRLPAALRARATGAAVYLAAGP